MSQSEDSEHDGNRSKEDLPSEETQREIILETMRDGEPPWVTLSTLEERLPYDTSRPTIETRLEELELDDRVRQRPFNPYADNPSKMYHLNHGGTNWMVPPDAQLLTSEEEQVLNEIRDEDGKLPDQKYLETPYEHYLLDTRIGDCFYQGHSFFGDITLGALALMIVSYVAFQTASALPVSQTPIAWVLLLSILTAILGVVGILSSAIVGAVEEVVR
ncbi:hypothetical protein ACAH01_08765 [Halomicrobium sp. HM KBTZ05]|uniref:hypothetical protein n=1 Tax=Halomicrobium sp. HM KBTZ05 TaxID=3242663 RepID=UPI003558AE66